MKHNKTEAPFSAPAIPAPSKASRMFYVAMSAYTVETVRGCDRDLTSSAACMLPVRSTGWLVIYVLGSGCSPNTVASALNLVLWASFLFSSFFFFWSADRPAGCMVSAESLTS